MEKGTKKKKAGKGGSSPRRLPADMSNKGQFSSPTSVVYPGTIIGFPDRLGTILKYSESYTFTGSATPAAQRWAVNSAFDPNSTGTGHQPSFYDTYSAVYGRYFVRQFKVEVDISNHTSTAGVWAVLGYSDQDISGSSVESIAEAKYTKLSTVALSAGGPSVKKMVLPWMATTHIMGAPYAEADDNMYALVTASPSDVAWGFLKFAADDATTSISVLARVTLYMEIMFKDLLPQVPSLKIFKPSFQEESNQPIIIMESGKKTKIMGFTQI